MLLGKYGEKLRICKKLNFEREEENVMIQQFAFECTSMEGLKIIHPFYASDERGFFMKTFEKNIFEEQGICLQNAEDIMSFSKKGVLRGLHFQTKFPQDKLIRVYSGEVFDVAVDLRKGSSTYGCWQGFYLSGDNRLGLYIPSGFAHGYLTLSDNAIFSYRCGTRYVPEADSGIIWDDKEINIKWPLERVESLIISEKDQKLQSYYEFRKSQRYL